MATARLIIELLEKSEKINILNQMQHNQKARGVHFITLPRVIKEVMFYKISVGNTSLTNSYISDTYCVPEC